MIIEDKVGIIIGELMVFVCLYYYNNEILLIVVDYIQLLSGSGKGGN